MMYKNDFNAIVSMIKQQKPTDEDIAHAKKYAQMWVYDAPGVKGDFETRYKALQKFFNECKEPFMKGFVLVPTFEVKNEEELKNYITGWKIKDIGIPIGQYVIRYNNWVLGTAVMTKDGLKSRFPRTKRTQRFDF